jgi:hypothetical protein
MNDCIVAPFRFRELNRPNPYSFPKLALITYSGLAPAGRTQDLTISRRLNETSLSLHTRCLS